MIDSPYLIKPGKTVRIKSLSTDDTGNLTGRLEWVETGSGFINEKIIISPCFCDPIG